MTKRSARVDDLGRAYAGSRLQIQTYVNRRSEELSQRVLDALPSLASMDARLRWVSPLEGEKFAEYRDRDFLRAIGLEHLDSALVEFWPRRGPSWDALAVVEVPRDPDRRGVVLVEAKSYPGEIYVKNGCQALSPRSRRKIEAALAQTKRWLGVPEDIDWMGRLYQSANRLAHLYFFREIVDIPAWLVNVYFLGDPRSPTTREDWQVALAQVKAELGLTGIAVPYTAKLFLEAKDRRELVGPTDAEKR